MKCSHCTAVNWGTWRLLRPDLHFQGRPIVSEFHSGCLAVWDRIISVEILTHSLRLISAAGTELLLVTVFSVIGGPHWQVCLHVLVSVCLSVYLIMCVCVSAGCFCVYNSKSSLLYVQQSVESSVLPDARHANPTRLLTLPIVVVLAHNPDVDERTLAFLREEGQLLADR